MKKRFGVIELSIFSVASLFFMNSVYRLASPALNQSSERSIASAAPAHIAAISSRNLATYDLNLNDQNPAFETTAQELRIICKERLPSQASIENTTNHHHATLLLDHTEGLGFSTDFIPLNEGKNTIEIFSIQRGGKKLARTLTVTRKQNLD